MVKIAVFLIVLAAVFAAKAASVVLAADDAILKSTSFSWMSVKPKDAVMPVVEAKPAKQKAPAPSRTYSPRARLA